MYYEDPLLRLRTRHMAHEDPWTYLHKNQGQLLSETARADADAAALAGAREQKEELQVSVCTTMFRWTR